MSIIQVNLANIIKTLDLSTHYLSPPMFSTESDASRFESNFRLDAKRSFRRLSKKHHSDHGGEDETFMMINDAYNSARKLRLRVQKLPQGSVGIAISAGGYKSI